MQVIDCEDDMASVPLADRIFPRTYGRFCPEQLCDMIYLVEGDPRVRQEIPQSLAAHDLKTMAFASARAYLDYIRRDTAACVILNFCLPDLCGLDLQQRLAERDDPPVIFISDKCEIASAVSAIKAGAIEFLIKPFDFQDLVSAVRAALIRDRESRLRKTEIATLEKRFSLLTPREREILPLLLGGLLNKQAASVLGISTVTLQMHRGQVMRKTQAKSFAELVRMSMKLHIPHWQQTNSSSTTTTSLIWGPTATRAEGAKAAPRSWTE
ncbi:response regulator transcription factor [Granulicella sp. WH15]|uniref:response regulator transcription factor n=1 Tax=Granulicella sp. WH15 TaxID=2602070 RepID=UPI001367253C|nr:response regulator [Granulicella sp. WH15]QHN03615.1 response regulator transcription factor [Granulicella sp. WH15]